jgi:hypothetical protein
MSDFNIDHYFDLALEEKAAELEVTVDYYLEEFFTVPEYQPQ